jgi:hypothetical protein
MPQQRWHLVWQTLGAWPPNDARGDWGRLAAFYAPLIAAKSAYVSYELEAHYAAEPCAALELAEADGKLLCRALLEASQDMSDRLTGGCPVLAAAFLPTQAHVLFRCDHHKINLVVGRLKSRIARSLIAHGRWRRGGRGIWGRSFWAAEIMRPDTAAEVKAFIKSLGGVQCGAR